MKDTFSNFIFEELLDCAAEQLYCAVVDISSWIEPWKKNYMYLSNLDEKKYMMNTLDEL